MRVRIRNGLLQVKLGDYGISRSMFPSGGAKGFGGTEGFMAPEIMRYNGEEEYTEKVLALRCVRRASNRHTRRRSRLGGLFLLRHVPLRVDQPQVALRGSGASQGVHPRRRPALPHSVGKWGRLFSFRIHCVYWWTFAALQELLYPCNVLDLMVVSWSAKPQHRPTSSQLVSVTTAPEFTHLLDVVSLPDAEALVLGAEAFLGRPCSASHAWSNSTLYALLRSVDGAPVSAASTRDENTIAEDLAEVGPFEAELWLSRSDGQLTVLGCSEFGWLDCKVGYGRRKVVCLQ